jgi:hypothetical protein
MTTDKTSWNETHFEVVSFITRELETYNGHSTVRKVHQEQGRGGLYDLAQEWTDIFESKYGDVEWGLELEYFEMLETFLNWKNEGL